MDFKLFFDQYEALVQKADAAFAQVQEKYPQQVHCGQGCSDCCHALYDLTLIEALYIKTKFDLLITGEARGVLIENANEADRKIHRLKRQAYKDHEAGQSESEILEAMARQRVRCPALNDENRCSIYAIRPITCRTYGIPTQIGGQGHTCGLSGFEQGESYPTLKLDVVFQRLYEISFALAQAIQSRYPKLCEVLVPLSMALLTNYTEEYLGVRSQSESTGTK